MEHINNNIIINSDTELDQYKIILSNSSQGIYSTFLDSYKHRNVQFHPLAQDEFNIQNALNNGQVRSLIGRCVSAVPTNEQDSFFLKIF
jgi:hypothetical protein